jgi:hypothetical protein
MIPLSTIRRSTGVKTAVCILGFISTSACPARQPLAELTAAIAEAARVDDAVVSAAHASTVQAANGEAAATRRGSERLCRIQFVGDPYAYTEAQRNESRPVGFEAVWDYATDRSASAQALALRQRIAATALRGPRCFLSTYGRPPDLEPTTQFSSVYGEVYIEVLREIRPNARSTYSQNAGVRLMVTTMKRTVEDEKYVKRVPCE